MFPLCLANLLNIGTLYPHTTIYTLNIWRGYDDFDSLCLWFFCSYYCFYYARLAGIVDVTLDLLSICCCWHMKLLHKICRLRQHCRLHLRLHLLVLVAVVVIVDVASLLLFFLLVSIMCSTCYACRTPSLSLSPSPSPLPLLLVLIIVVALSLAFGFRRFSCNLPGKLLST